MINPKIDRFIIALFVIVFILTVLSFSMGSVITTKKIVNATIVIENRTFIYERHPRGVVPMFFFNPSVERRVFMGNVSAQITMIIYINPLSNASTEFYNTVFPDIKRDFIDTGVVRYYHKNLITEEDIRSNSMNVAYAVWMECINAISPDKYWTFYDKLFKIKPNNTREILGELGINDKDFEYCISHNYFEDVKDDIQETEEFGINIIPTIYLGIKGRDNMVLLGIVSYDRLRREIKFASSRIGV